MYEICMLKITKPLEKEIKDLNKQRDTRVHVLEDSTQ